MPQRCVGVASPIASLWDKSICRPIISHGVGGVNTCQQVPIKVTQPRLLSFYLSKNVYESYMSPVS